MRAILNLTPHPIRLYAATRPDGIDDLDQDLLGTIPPEATPARLATIDLGTNYETGLDPDTGRMWTLPVELVEYSHANDLPAKREGVALVVSLVVALALASRRSDLRVPYHEVRNSSGTVIGCRLLAQPV